MAARNDVIFCVVDNEKALFVFLAATLGFQVHVESLLIIKFHLISCIKIFWTDAGKFMKKNEIKIKRQKGHTFKSSYTEVISDLVNYLPFNIILQVIRP